MSPERLILLVLVAAAASGNAQDSRPQPSAPEAQLAIEKALRARLDDPATPLDIDLIMLGEDFVGADPEGLRWAGLGEPVLFFSWRRGGGERGLWSFDFRTSALEARPEAEFRPPVYDGQVVRSPRGDGRAWVERGDIHVEVGGLIRPIAVSDSAESSPVFAPDGETLFFQRDGEVFAASLAAPFLIRQLSSIRSGRDPEDDKEPESRPQKADRARRLEEEERSLLRSIHDESVREEERKARRRAFEAREARKKRFVPKDAEILRLMASPRGDVVAAMVAPRGEKTRAADMPRYVRKDGYAAIEATRPKVGDRGPVAELHLIDTATGDARRVDFGQGERRFDLHQAVFSPSGRYLIAVLEAVDNKTGLLMRIDPKTAAVTVLHQVDDPAWVHHFVDAQGFLPSGEVFWFTSEKSGFRHLYRLDLETAETRALTAGPWEVRGVQWHPGLGRFLLHTSEVSPFETHAYLADPVTGEREALTRRRGNHEVSISPDGSLIAEIFGASNTPSEVFVRRRSEADTQGLKITDRPSPAFRSRAWLAPEIVRFPARDGALVPMRLYRPKEPRRNRPLVIFVHGAGYLQNVHEGWSRYYREYMFHNLLVERGYFVADLDYRGSAGYGRDWRTVNYRHMGSFDLTDQVDCAQWMIAQCGVDPKSIGIYGGSYGGFITLMALFTAGDVFRAGAALRPVTDWAHYNHGYTSNILNLPTEDAEAYRRSSPIYFAEGLKGDLLICHGVVDDNVHFQDSVRLTQRLIELRKENWELAIYPVEAHGFVDSASWADEYKRILRLFERTIGGR